jgi:hypothetical protein
MGPAVLACFPIFIAAFSCKILGADQSDDHTGNFIIKISPAPRLWGVQGEPRAKRVDFSPHPALRKFGPYFHMAKDREIRR